MKTIRIAAVALNQTARDWSGNAHRIRAALSEIKEQGVAVACFPELCISGYGCEDGFSHPGTISYSLEVLEQLLPETKGIVVNFGLPLAYRKAVYNCTVVIADGSILGVLPKKSLAGDGIHYEPRWFKAWPEGIVDEMELFGSPVPIGDLLFDIGGVRIGYEICEEAWAADRPGRWHASHAIDIECNPSASHFAFDKKRTRELFVAEGSRAFCCAYIYSNLLGCESGRQIYDGGNLIALDGEIISRAERFLFSDSVITATDVDLDYTRTLFSKKAWSEPAFDAEVTIVKSDFSPPLAESPPRYGEALEPDWEKTETPIFEEFTRSVALALFDYMRKSWSRGFVISLSGGCDSASVSVLARLSLEMAKANLSQEEFFSKLQYAAKPKDSKPKDLGKLDGVLSAFITTVWQQTENNSEETKQSARSVAEGVKSTHFEIEIDEWVASYKEKVEGCLDKELSYKADGLVLQNLQARIRNPLPWALANHDGKLLLTTSNRSESALGYCTMDGDTAGGLNPIGGVDKAFLRRWLKWMEETGPDGYSPVSELKEVNSLTPSAELLPLEDTQTDEDDLGPYEVCTFIEEHFMRRGQTAADILPSLLQEFSSTYSGEELYGWLRKFFTLFGRNQWKRERLAPCFHVDHMNLDPRTWCRWPILNGGFERELAHLDEVAKEQGLQV